MEDTDVRNKEKRKVSLVSSFRSNDGVVTCWDEMKVQLNFAWPVSLTTLCRIFVFTTDAAFVGHIGTDELAAANLCGTIFDAVATFGFSFSMSLTTLCSQAYGARSYKLVGAYYQIALVAITALSCVMIPVLMFLTGPILRSVGITDAVVHRANEFSLIYAGRFWPVIVFQASRAYLNSQKVIRPALYVSVSCTALNVALNYVLIYGIPSLGTAFYGMGFRGAPLASLVTSTMQVLLLWLYMYASGCHKKTWQPWNRQIFKKKHLKRYLLMAWGTFGGLAADSWVLTAVSLLAGMLGAVPVATQGILYNVWGLCWGIYFGLATAAQTRVSQHLGAGTPLYARRAVLVALLLTLALCIVLSSLYVFLCRLISQLYTTDPNVLNLVHSLRWLMVTCFTLALLSQTILLVLDACARPSISAMIAFLSSICVQLPVSYVMAFHYDLHLKGLWWGAFASEAMRLVAAAIFVTMIDWDAESQRARLASEESVLLVREVNNDDTPDTAPQVTVQRKSLVTVQSPHSSADDVSPSGPLPSLPEFPPPAEQEKHTPKPCFITLHNS